MIERILKIVYVFAMFINVGLYGVSFILKLNVIPIQVDLSGLSAVEKREMLSNLAINYPLGESMYYVAIGLSIVLAIVLLTYLNVKLVSWRRRKLDLFLEFLDSVSICLKLTESFSFMWWYYELYRLEM